jgi:hypothetical protein
VWTTRGGVPARKNGLLMPETPDRPRRTGLLALDFAIAASAIIISFASLWVALRADRTQEQLLQASVWPYVQYFSSDATGNGDKRLAFALRNAGVGPAIVRTFAVEYNGHPYSTLRELLSACCHVPAKRHPGILSSTVRDSVIMAHEDMPFIVVLPGKTDAHEYASIDAARFGIGIQICYCSVLGDCWFFDSKRDDQPNAVRKCPPVKIPYDT